MTVYVLGYSTDYGDRGFIFEPFKSMAEATKRFNALKKLAAKEELAADDASRVYHILPEDKATDKIEKYIVHNTEDLINLIKRL